MLGKKPLFIKNDKLPKIIDDKSIGLFKDGRIPEYATFDEWKAMGYTVMNGEKSYRKENGVAVFHKGQTTETRHYDDCLDEWDWWERY